MMGSPEGERGRDDDEAMHQVCVEDFWMGKHEVTNTQFRAFRPYHDSGTFRGQTLNDPEQPVCRVSWIVALVSVTDATCWLILAACWLVDA